MEVRLLPIAGTLLRNCKYARHAFSANILRELKELGATFVMLYNKLSLEALKKEIRAWKLVPKFHTFLHLC